MLQSPKERNPLIEADEVAWLIVQVPDEEAILIFDAPLVANVKGAEIITVPVELLTAMLEPACKEVAPMFVRVMPLVLVVIEIPEPLKEIVEVEIPAN